MTALERFTRMVSPEPTTGCWLWTGCVSIGDYAKFYYNGALGWGHRFAYETWVGPIPQGFVLDHRCRVRSCVNPAHLRPVTKAANVLENSLSPSALHARKAKCGVCGGEYTWRHRRHARRCASCDNARSRAYRQRNLARLQAYDRARPARPRKKESHVCHNA